MKKTLLLLFTLFSLTTFAQRVSEVLGQPMTLDKWEQEAKTNIRLLPKYGYALKTEAQKKSDQELIASVLEKDSSRRKASDQFIQLGFSYLNRDIKSAMYRFNQAYLLDSTNTDIYWGFAAVYMTLGDYSKAEKQYQEGLAINPNSTHLLTDYGTYFLAQYYGLKLIDEKSALSYLDSAITYMLKSFELDATNQDTSFKLTVCYWNKSDCDNAWKYYDICKSLGGKPITDDFTKDLKKKCKR